MNYFRTVFKNICFGYVKETSIAETFLLRTQKRIIWTKTDNNHFSELHILRLPHYNSNFQLIRLYFNPLSAKKKMHLKISSAEVVCCK